MDFLFVVCDWFVENVDLFFGIVVVIVVVGFVIFLFGVGFWVILRCV